MPLYFLLIGSIRRGGTKKPKRMKLQDEKGSAGTMPAVWADAFRQAESGRTCERPPARAEESGVSK